MSGFDYSELDDAIVAAVKSGVRDFTGLLSDRWVGNASAALEFASPKDRRGDRKPAWRFVDGRLQALRRKGALTYTRTAGWVAAMSTTDKEKQG